MLEPVKRKILEELVAGASREELAWMQGYLSGIFERNGISEEKPQLKAASKKITIAYGTETGNSKKIASDFAAQARKNGIHAKLVGLDQYRLADLGREEYFLTIVSTQGEGDPPATAKKFYDHIHSNGFKLDQLKYGVLALGDTSYPLFCKAGEDVDLQLQKLGAQRIVPLQKCDLDYEIIADDWFKTVLHQLNTGNDKPAIREITSPAKNSSGKKFYEGKILASVNLNDRGSEKETYHIEIAAEGVDYLPGDSLSLVPQNPEILVKTILEKSGLDHTYKILYRNDEYTAEELLRTKLEIIYLPERVVQKYARLSGQEIPATRIGLLDLLKIYPIGGPDVFIQLFEILEPISPRLYSISSSPEGHPGEIHITVARNRFCVNDEWKVGLCSDYLSQFKPGSSLTFHIHRNHLFRLPDEEKDIIMVGPGTGIAPFRSFLAERDATGASGRNWLFFGEQHFVTDFLYQTEIQNWKELGVLHKIDLAFSRDQAEKIYVQDKIRKKGQQVYEWLESGAYLYLCGSRDPMSLDVEKTLIELAQQHGNKSEPESLEWLGQIKEAGRYLVDVY